MLPSDGWIKGFAVSGHCSYISSENQDMKMSWFFYKILAVFGNIERSKGKTLLFVIPFEGPGR
jgi:hypothetical protein